MYSCNPNLGASQWVGKIIYNRRRLSFIEQGFRRAELSILNHMQMSIKAISLADIVTSNKFEISQNAFLLLASNGLREQFEWPNAPPKSTKKQVECWQHAL